MALIDDVYALITTPQRRIGTLIPNVVILETHVDDMQITDHPVETGAAITDHAFLLPQQIEMQVGYSNSAVGSEGYVQEIYEEFLALQKSRVPFTVTTGKRQYSDMLIKSLVVTTDAHSEWALNLTVCMRQIILTSTQETSAPGALAAPQDAGLRSVVAAGALPVTTTGGAPASPFGDLSGVSGSFGGSVPQASVFSQINWGSVAAADAGA